MLENNIPRYACVLVKNAPNKDFHNSLVQILYVLSLDKFAQ